jgi:hypothetical protein
VDGASPRHAWSAAKKGTGGGAAAGAGGAMAGAAAGADAPRPAPTSNLLSNIRFIVNTVFLIILSILKIIYFVRIYD